MTQHEGSTGNPLVLADNHVLDAGEVLYIVGKESGIDRHISGDDIWWLSARHHEKLISLLNPRHAVNRIQMLIVLQSWKAKPCQGRVTSTRPRLHLITLYQSSGSINNLLEFWCMGPTWLGCPVQQTLDHAKAREQSGRAPYRLAFTRIFQIIYFSPGRPWLSKFIGASVLGLREVGL